MSGKTWAIIPYDEALLESDLLHSQRCVVKNGANQSLARSRAQDAAEMAVHEPTPLPACDHPLPALRGEGRERGDQKRFMAPTHVQFLEVFASHEPYPRIPSFSPSGGEGARRAVEVDSGRFMASIHVRIAEVFPVHEPAPSPLPSPPPQGERVAGGRVRGRFIVQMRWGETPSSPDLQNNSRTRRSALRPIGYLHRWIGWAATLLLSFSASVCAHQGSSSYLSVSVNGTNVTSQWDISLIDLEQVIGLDANHDGDISWGEIKAKQREIETYEQSRLQVKVDGAVRRWKTTDLLVDHFSDGAYAVLRFAVENPTPPGNLEVDYRAFFDTDALHRGLFRLEYAGKVQTAVFSPDKPRQQFALAGSSRWRQFLDFNREGVWHIWSGYDHILFLLALLLPSVLKRGPDGWRVVDHFRPALINVLKIVTAFTLAHSLTLSLATLGIVRVPARVVESTIAASVTLAAANNIRPIVAERGWIVAFCFGLVHGFGFANALRELGLARQTLALTLVGFNLGVEFGQLAIVAVFLPLAFGLRSSWVYQRLTFRFGSAIIVLLAATWMMERIFDFKWLPF